MCLRSQKHRFGESPKLCPIREQKLGVFKDERECMYLLFTKNIDWCCRQKTNPDGISLVAKAMAKPSSCGKVHWCVG